MAAILHLPPELKIEVFSHLSDFDDVHNLGEACWQFQAVLDHEPTHRSILKSIVQTSPVFTHDIKLARIQDQTSALQSRYAKDAKLSDSERLPGSALSQCLAASPCSITDADIDSISHRWQSAHVLQSLYNNPNISKLYTADTEFNEETYAPVNGGGLAEAASYVQEHLSQDDPAILPNDNSDQGRNAEQTQRFYKALTAINLTLSSHWLLSRTHTSTWQELQTLFDAVWSLWDWRAKQISPPALITPLNEPSSPYLNAQPASPNMLAPASPLFQVPCPSPALPPPRQEPHEDLRDVVEMLEIYNFLYTFLLRVVFPDPSSTRPWLPESMENVFVENGGGFRGYHWSFFVRSCDRILSPTDILDVLTASCSAPSAEGVPAWPEDKVNYLQARGAIDIDHGTSSTRHPDGVYLDWCISERELAECVWRRVNGGEVPMQAQLPMGRRLWLAFRSVWETRARGGVFQWEDQEFNSFVGSLELAMARGWPMDSQE